MRSKVRVTVAPQAGSNLFKYGAALGVCLIVAYSAHALAPHIFKSRVIEARPEAILATNALPSSEPRVLFSPIEAPVKDIEPIAPTTNSTLAQLTACRASIQANRGFAGFTPAEAAAIASSRVGGMSPTQIKEVCRLITEGLVKPPKRG